MSYTLVPNPKCVLQLGDYCCWAAALDSWLDAVHAGYRATQTELNGLGPFGFDVEQFRQWKVFEMETRIVGAFTEREIETTLRTFGYLYVGVRLNKAWWHDVVLYGVTTKGETSLYHFMDPESGMLVSRSGDFFFKKRIEPRVLIGWHKDSRGVRHGQ